MLDLTYDMERVQVTDGEVADAIPVTLRELLINGKKAGTISLMIWGAASGPNTSWSSAPASRHCSSACRRCFRAKRFRSM